MYSCGPEDGKGYRLIVAFLVWAAMSPAHRPSSLARSLALTHRSCFCATNRHVSLRLGAPSHSFSSFSKAKHPSPSFSHAAQTPRLSRLLLLHLQSLQIQVRSPKRFWSLMNRRDPSNRLCFFPISSKNLCLKTLRTSHLRLHQHRPHHPNSHRTLTQCRWMSMLPKC